MYRSCPGAVKKLEIEVSDYTQGNNGPEHTIQVELPLSRAIFESFSAVDV